MTQYRRRILNDGLKNKTPETEHQVPKKQKTKLPQTSEVFTNV